MGGQLATGSSIYMASAGVPAADGAGLSSIKSFSQLLTSIAAMPLAGGTFTGNVLFTDNTYDIGASGATRPRTVYAGTSVITPLLNNTNAAALTIGNSTYGVTVPGAAVVSGDISMSKTSAQGYLTAYSPSLLKYVSTSMTNGGAGVIQANGDSLLLQSNTAAITLGSDLLLQTPANGSAYVFRSGVNSTFDVYNSGSPSYKYTRLTHDGTSGILSTSAGNLNLIPTGGTVAVTGGITASGNVSYAQGLSTGTVTKSANYTTTADDYRVNVTTNSIDITFETAVGCANREHEVINSGSGVVTLKTTSAQTISGSASGALTLAQWKSIRVVSDGANWLIMSQIT